MSSSTQAYESTGDCEAGSSISLLKSGIANAAWWTFAGGMLLESVCGSLWTFSGYSHTFQSSLDSGLTYTQTQVQTLALFATAGNYIVLDSGFIVARFGSTVGMIYGCSMVCFGYLALWVSITMKAQPPFAVFAFWFVVFGHGCGTTDNALLTELLSRFPNHTGYVVGCVKGFYGLSAGLLTVLANLMWDVESARPGSFILFLSVYAAILGVICIPMMHFSKGVVTESSSQVHRKLVTVSIGVLVLAWAVLMFAINHLKVITESDSSMHIVILVVLALVVGALFFVVLPAAQGVAIEEETSLLLAPQPGDVPYATMLRSREFLILFVILISGIGTGLMFTNNVGQIVPAFHGTSRGSSLASPFVAMVSCLNAVGRLSSGFLSESLKAYISRPWFLVFFLGLQMVAFLLLVVVGAPILWPAGGLLSYSWGGVWAMVPVLVRELWGPMDFSIKYAMSVLAGIGGSLLFSTLMAARLFDREAKARHEAPFCYAESCFTASFTAAAFANFLALMLAVVLCNWTASVYNKAVPSSLDDARLVPTQLRSKDS